jgi:hypothetical protein
MFSFPIWLFKVFLAAPQTNVWSMFPRCTQQRPCFDRAMASESEMGNVETGRAHDHTRHGARDACARRPSDVPRVCDRGLAVYLRRRLAFGTPCVGVGQWDLRASEFPHLHTTCFLDVVAEGQPWEAISNLHESGVYACARDNMTRTFECSEFWKKTNWNCLTILKETRKEIGTDWRTQPNRTIEVRL